MSVERQTPETIAHHQPSQYTILLVDDEFAIRLALRAGLKAEGYNIIEADSGAKALAILKSRPVDLIISDQTMPQMTGIEMLRTARMIRPDSMRIILTGYAEADVAISAINEGAVYRFLLKPWDNATLISSVGLALRQLDHLRQAERLHEKARLATLQARSLENESPGITHVVRDKNGAILLNLE